MSQNIWTLLEKILLLIHLANGWIFPNIVRTILWNAFSTIDSSRSQNKSFPWTQSKAVAAVTWMPAYWAEALSFLLVPLPELSVCLPEVPCLFSTPGSGKGPSGMAPGASQGLQIVRTKNQKQVIWKRLCLWTCLTWGYFKTTIRLRGRSCPARKGPLPGFTTGAGQTLVTPKISIMLKRHHIRVWNLWEVDQECTRSRKCKENETKVMNEIGFKSSWLAKELMLFLQSCPTLCDGVSDFHGFPQLHPPWQYMRP